MTTTASGALKGVKVIDLTRVLAGPLCTQMLADHGAQVIKVEPPSGDETRGLGPPFDGDGNAAYFLALNRGKQAISLDLSKPEAQEVLHRLLADADVLVENFLPGTLERWGLGFEQTLAARYPRLIHCSITGFGRDGPLGGLPGYDAVVSNSLLHHLHDPDVFWRAVREAGRATAAPVCGLRATPALRSTATKLPKPISFTSAPRVSDSVTPSVKASSAVFAWSRLIPAASKLPCLPNSPTS